jgi:signal transduction histidine kinase
LADIIADEDVSGTYGLFSIRERLHHLGGSLGIESNPGEGTRVTVAAPLSYSVSSHEGDLA